MFRRNPTVALISESFAISKSEHRDLEDHCGGWRLKFSQLFMIPKPAKSAVLEKGKHPEKAKTFQFVLRI